MGSEMCIRDSTTQQSDGLEVAEGIVEACALALVDPYRAATHNKGIMNGIDPVLVATGNDWRAVEAGAHAYAARNGQYESLSRWEINSKNHLVGTLELPVATSTGSIPFIMPLLWVAAL